MTTDKKNIQALAEVCRIRGIRDVVFSPGSRSAPLVIAFQQAKGITCTVIADERSAGFFALGVAQQARRPVAVVCTSGTAVLNLAPAVCEAWYQQVSLLILTADRPPEYIGVGENQAIVQTDIYHHYIRASYTLPDNPSDAAAMTAEAMDLTTAGYCAPVHINIPLREPLYGKSDTVLNDLLVAHASPAQGAVTAPSMTLSARTMLICGMHEPSEKLQALISGLSQQGHFTIVNEPLSNLSAAGTIDDVDSAIAMLDEADHARYRPDTIITIGRQTVSKRLRQFLRKAVPTRHYHVSTDGGEWNGFGAKEYKHIEMADIVLLEAMSHTKAPSQAFCQDWRDLDQRAAILKKEFTEKVPFSDWSVFAKLTATFPEKASIQYGNSSPVRYGCLWRQRSGQSVYSNRGTSGIDGCVSTAAGAAFHSAQMTICIVGDVSFFYDSNALWNNALSPHLRIIVINNGGGNIFRMIEGPDSVEDFETFFETRHQLSAEYLAGMYQIPYYFCEGSEDMDFVLGQFYKPQKGNRPAILEIKTDGQVGARVYKEYLEFLRTKR